MAHPMQIPEYLAVSTDNTLFMIMSQDEAFRCIYAQEGLCTIETYMTNQAFSCITAIYMDNVAKIKSQCDFQIWPNARLNPAIYPLAPGQYLEHNLESPLQILCKTGSKQITVDTQNVISISCDCKFDTILFKSLSSLYTCNKDVISPSLEYLINLPLALHFDSLQKLPMGTTKQTTKQPLQLQIHNITKFTDMYDKCKTRAKELSIDLKYIVRDAQQPLRDVAYIPDQMPIAQMGSFWQWNFSYGDTIYAVLFVILFAMLGFSYYHQQILTATVIKMFLDKVEAKVVDTNSAPWPEPPPEPYCASPSFDSVSEQIYVQVDSHPITTFCVCLVVFLSCMIYIIKGLSLLYVNFAKIRAIMHRKCQSCVSPRQYQHSYYLYIKITNGHLHAIVYITAIYLDTVVTSLSAHPQIQ